MSIEEIRARLARLRADDLAVPGGRLLAHGYDSGLPAIDQLGREAVAAYAGSNGLDPGAFPSLLEMENDLVGIAARLLDGPESVVGSVTGGAGESVLLAVQAARDSRPDVARPRMLVPSTAHAAFDRAAHYLRVEAVEVPVGPDLRADAAAMAALIDDSTVLVAVSAPSYAHGVVDPVAEVAAAAAERGVRCHVDAGVGGWLLPYAAQLGRRTPGWSFAVEGVTSISVDLQAYAYAPVGTALLLHRSAALRRPQLFASADWPGYPLVGSTLQSSRSGGPLAGAWAVVSALGESGYLGLTAEVLEAVDRIVAGVAGIDGLDLVVQPDATQLALATDQTCDPFTVCEEMARRGWHVQSQLSQAGRDATVHLSVSAGTLPHVDALLYDLRLAVMSAQTRGPVSPDPAMAAVVRSLGPDEVTDEVADHLVAALLGEGGTAVLEPSAVQVNALLDLAPPDLREALLVAFLDRLSRPRPVVPAHARP